MHIRIIAAMQRILRRSSGIALVATTLLTCATALWSSPVPAQARSDRPAPQATDARSIAPYDLTGYWVAVITEDWRFRMITPGKGEYGSIPLNFAAKQIADNWDPQRDEAAGEQCKSYGVGAIMRAPTRLHITWQDADTLKVETDEGTQTRLLHFKPSAATDPSLSLQGHSSASWEFTTVRTDNNRHRDPAVRGPGMPTAPGADQPTGSGTLKVVTTRMLPGYLRKNGVPYSSEMTMLEYWDVHRAPNGDQWLVIPTVLDDPQYLQSPYIYSPQFRKEANGSKWAPTPCSSR